MKKKEKQRLLILILISLLIIVAIWFMTIGDKEEQKQPQQVETGYVQTQSDGTKVNTSSKIKEERTIEGIFVENIRFTEKDGQTNLVADITNTTSEEKERFLVDIVLYDTEGNEMGRMPGIIGEMQAGETVEMQAGILGITKDYINAYDLKIEKKQ